MVITLPVARSRSYSLTANVAIVVAGSLMIAALAQLSVPLWPVPVTGQTLGVLLVGALLGSRRGSAAVMLYLAEGAVGLPFFASGRAGVAVLAGPTAGYLLGFVAAAWMIGLITDRGLIRKPAIAAAVMTAASAAIYLTGCLWLARFVGADQVVALGLLPFVTGDVLKIVLAVIVVTLPAQRYRS